MLECNGVSAKDLGWNDRSFVCQENRLQITHIPTE